jgi:Type IV secretion system pilin
MSKKIIFAITLALVLSPFLAFACTMNSNVWNIAVLKGPLISCTGAGPTGGTDNKNCSDVCDLVCTAGNVVYFGIGVVIWIVLPIVFAWSGILLIISTGNPEQIGKAKKMLTAAVIGLLIVICAYLIVYTFLHVLGLTNVIGGFGGSAACTVSA